MKVNLLKRLHINRWTCVNNPQWVSYTIAAFQIIDWLRRRPRSCPQLAAALSSSHFMCEPSCFFGFQKMKVGEAYWRQNANTCKHTHQECDLTQDLSVRVNVDWLQLLRLQHAALLQFTWYTKWRAHSGAAKERSPTQLKAQSSNPS